MTVQDIMNILLKRRYHEAFIACWLRFNPMNDKSDLPFFMAAESRSRADEVGYKNAKEKIKTALFNENALKIKPALIAEFPLALLVALDEFLFEKYDVIGNTAPPGKINFKNTSYYIYRRMRKAHLFSRHRKQAGNPLA